MKLELEALEKLAHLYRNAYSCPRFERLCVGPGGRDAAKAYARRLRVICHMTAVRSEGASSATLAAWEMLAKVPHCTLCGHRRQTPEGAGVCDACETLATARQHAMEAGYM